jgi:dolichol-phosphate mannosyltransferase
VVAEGFLYTEVVSESRLLIIIPCFKEAENIAALVRKICELYATAHVLVVDDSSPDGTADRVRDVQREQPERVHLLVRAGKGGRGSAVIEGFRIGLRDGFSLVMEMDADFSHRPEEIANFLTKITSVDCVVGSRYLPGSEIHDWGWKRTFFSRWANRYARSILRIPLTDYTNGFRCYRRSAIESLDLDHIDAKGYVVLSEVAYQLHCRGKTFGEVPVIFVNRRRGISNLSFHEISEAFLSVLRIRFGPTFVHIEKIIKFAFAGAAGAVVDLGTLTLLVQFGGISPHVGVFISTSLALGVVFLLNRSVTFRGHHQSFLQQVTKFLLVYAAAFCFNVGIASGLIWAGVHYFIAKVVAILIVAVWNYLLLHFFVFRPE